MSFQRDNPVELPDGRLVCGSHGLVVCGRCCVDYSFMDELLGEDDGDSMEDDEDSMEDDEDLIGDVTNYVVYDEDVMGDVTSFVVYDAPLSLSTDSHKIRVGTGQVIPEEFVPPRETDTPQQLFCPLMSVNATPVVHRFIRRSHPTEFLIYTDGACLGNGGQNPKAGCAFVFRSSAPGEFSHVAFRLEKKGPTGEQHNQTSNRAELRAVIAALRFRNWKREGCKTLVIATDSEYVVKGVTGYVRRWLRNGWKTQSGAPVKNKDLWQILLGEAERWSGRDMIIKFWRIPREWNTEADRWAKDAAGSEDDAMNEFRDKLGVLV